MEIVEQPFENRCLVQVLIGADSFRQEEEGEGGSMTYKS